MPSVLPSVVNISLLVFVHHIYPTGEPLNSFLLLETSLILQDSTQTFPLPHHACPLNPQHPIGYCPEMSLALLRDSLEPPGILYCVHFQVFQMFVNYLPN